MKKAPYIQRPSPTRVITTMTPASIDVVGIGNAIVDVTAHADDEFHVREALVKGTMTLIDVPRAEALYQMMGPAIDASGGSAGDLVARIGR